MTTQQLEEAILNQYDNGRYTPTGSDGGALCYARVNVNGTEYSVNITEYRDIKQIRRIWQLKVTGTDEYIINLNHEYYIISKALHGGN